MNKTYELIIFDWHGTLLNPTCGLLFADSLEVLTTLKQNGYLIAIATTLHRLELDDALFRFDLDELIDESQCGDEAKAKPDPQMINNILAKLNINREKAMMVGDSIYDFGMAKLAGIDAVAITADNISEKQLHHYQVKYHIQQIKELLNYLANKR